jgi:uncharacterized membrane protein
MSKRTKGKRTSTSAAEAAPPATRTQPNWPLLALSVVGMLLTAYLTWTKFAGSAVQGCAVGGGCDVVLSSRWSTILGLPTSLWGFGAYATLAAIAVLVRREVQHWTYAWTVALIGVCYSLYLTTISLTVLNAACPYCLTSLALMTTTLGLVVVQRPAQLAHRSWVGLAIGRIALAGVIVVALHAGYTAPEEADLGPEDPAVRALAEYLSDQGVLFYGASWCPHCQEQKRLFGASVKRLPYVECNLAGPNAPQSSACTQAGVSTYPTWIIGDRRIVGQVMTLADLAAATNYPGAAAFK